MFCTCWQVAKSAALCGKGCKLVVTIDWFWRVCQGSGESLPPVRGCLPLLGYESLWGGQVQVAAHINGWKRAHLDLASGMNQHDGCSRRQRNTTGFLTSALIRALGCGFTSGIATKSRSKLCGSCPPPRTPWMVDGATAEA